MTIDGLVTDWRLSPTCARLVINWRLFPLSLNQVVAEFNETFEHFLDNHLKYDRDTRLPLRFADASIYRHRPRTQHPVYQTSNNAYGLKKPSQQQVTCCNAPSSGGFGRPSLARHHTPLPLPLPLLLSPPPPSSPLT